MLLYLLFRFVIYLIDTCGKHKVLWYGAHLWLTVAAIAVLAVGLFLQRDHPANLPIALIVSGAFFVGAVAYLYAQTGNLAFSLVFSISIVIAGIV